MGGNLFKLGRLPRPEYLVLEAEMRSYLDQKFGQHYRIPRYYGNKADFGDMDIILSSEALATDWDALRMEIVADLGITEYKRQPKLLSTVLQNFQVDFFIVQASYFQSTWQFLCYNDLGNLLGKLFRRFNLKYGEKGLLYVYRRADDHYHKDLPITRDMGRILGFLGLEFSRWDAGFATLAEMFEWVVSSPYFSYKPYFKKSSSTDKRIRQRNTMQKFVEWLTENDIQKDYQFAEDRGIYLPQIEAAFPEANLSELIAEEQRREKIAEENREKFNGRIIMEMFPHLQGKELGGFIQGFKATYTDFEAEINSMTAQAIRTALQDFAADNQALPPEA